MSKPATAPVITATVGLMYAADAELATSPASKPLRLIVGSGLRVVIIMYVAATMAPLAPARSVTAAINAADSGPRPALKPSQPIASRKLPSNDKGMLCAVIGSTAPLLL